MRTTLFRTRPRRASGLLALYVIVHGPIFAAPLYAAGRTVPVSVGQTLLQQERHVEVAVGSGGIALALLGTLALVRLVRSLSDRVRGRGPGG